MSPAQKSTKEIGFEFPKIGAGDTASNRLALRVTCYVIANGGVVGYRNHP